MVSDNQKEKSARKRAPEQILCCKEDKNLCEFGLLTPKFSMRYRPAPQEPYPPFKNRLRFSRTEIVTTITPENYEDAPVFLTLEKPKNSDKTWTTPKLGKRFKLLPRPIKKDSFCHERHLDKFLNIKKKDKNTLLSPTLVMGQEDHTPADDIFYGKNINPSGEKGKLRPIPIRLCDDDPLSGISSSLTRCSSRLSREFKSWSPDENSAFEKIPKVTDTCSYQRFDKGDT